MADIDSYIEAIHSTLSCLYCHTEDVIRCGYSLGLQRYGCKIPDCRKRFNNLTESPLAKLHHKDKWFSYLRYVS
ncbi:MAG: IS1/IS1595 family N-terminal zinc-binding domain-containing protein [Arsenophonus sp. NEOnobi-MAG3]